MKNIERGLIKHLVILIITISILSVIIYPLLDLIITKFLTNSEFIYSIKNHIVQPITSGFLVGLLLWMIDKKSK